MAILDWQALTRLTGGAPVQVERVRIEATGIAIEGQFGLPPLAQLPAEDQIFVAAFVRCHGSIKQMEQYFGVSYPTIKNRLNRIGARAFECATDKDFPRYRATHDAAERFADLRRRRSCQPDRCGPGLVSRRFQG